MTNNQNEDYGIAKVADTKPVVAPDLPYQPSKPKNYNPPIGVIGCGGISSHHLKAYQVLDLNVVALCDINLSRAETQREKFYPKATVHKDYREIFDRDEVEIVDIATHPEERGPMMEDSLHAGKHVLSQKPFVLDLDYGQKIIELAKEKNRKIAVNQNGRWAPHFSYMRQAIAAGYIGEVLSVHQEVDWDHSWIRGTEFEKIDQLILYDFGVHWFDIVSCFMAERKLTSAYAAINRSSVQTSRPCMLAHAVADYENAQATWAFNADTRFGPRDQTTIVGSKGTLRSWGVDLTKQEVTLYTEEGHAIPDLKGTWFDEGFQGTMGELLCAIEEKREPAHSAENNLKSLKLCFSVLQSVEENQMIKL